MSTTYPPVAVFADLNMIIRTPSGVEYRGALRQHPSTKEPGEHWYEGFLQATHKDHVLADTNLANAFKRAGERPGYFHPDSTLEPLRLKLNRIPKAMRTERNAETLIGEVWTHEGLWTVIASPSDSAKLHLAGSVVPSRHELAHEGSAIRHFQQPASGGDEVPAIEEAAPAKARARAPGRKPA